MEKRHARSFYSDIVILSETIQELKNGKKKKNESRKLASKMITKKRATTCLHRNTANTQIEL